jgi:hypothetical protein
MSAVTKNWIGCIENKVLVLELNTYNIFYIRTDLKYNSIYS